MPYHDKCCVPQCSPYQTRHRFPNPGKYHERFRKWVHSINNMEINEMDPALVYSSKRVCHKHFEAKYISTRSNRLHMNAIPTLYSQGRGKHRGCQKETDLHVQKYYYDKKGIENLPKVKEGDKIVMRKDGIWEPGTVIGEHQSPRSYIVEDDSGKILRRNRKLLKNSSSDFSKPSDESSEGSGRSGGRVSRTIRKPVRFNDYILS
ncbi:hypothetical protein JTB14_036239 [Gonioctena quinquepunctata]|nr:hypothetical protein JTB14_036239 [Gonioctena quinquepunctata]